jgi:hypothetical protein
MAKFSFLGTIGLFSSAYGAADYSHIPIELGFGRIDFSFLHQFILAPACASDMSSPASERVSPNKSLHAGVSVGASRRRRFIVSCLNRLLTIVNLLLDTQALSVYVLHRI